ncbi:MAG: TonB-dependent receptor plug domain-containing protein, partial [Bacteroidetes bacterium]|nr:TonB-dependent receptor plug domain-containing protein [Bacteroidota bacterium]
MPSIILHRFALFALLALAGMQGFAQTPAPERVTIRGIVLSDQTKSPMKGASITIAGTKKGATTDEQGHFSIRLNKGQTLEFNHVGFEKQQYKALRNDSISIVMKLHVTENDEVVVIGYGSVKKSHLTGAVAQLKNDNLNEIPVGRADLALLGKLAGVSVMVTDAQAGAAPVIQVRGATSITAGTNPLIVVDGYPVPTDLSAIDMNDVESIEVLKDAASAAIYGSRGGNGVLLITTKSGKTGRSRVNLNVNHGVKSPYRKMNLYNLEDWKLFVQLNNNGVVPTEITQAERYNANTNAQDIIFHNSHFSNFQGSASGGNNLVKYYLSGNALIDDGIMYGNNSKRFSLKGSLEAKPSQKLTVGISFTPSYTITYNIPVTVQEAVRTIPNWMPLYHTAVTSQYTGKPIGSIANTKDFDPGRNPN